MSIVIQEASQLGGRALGCIHINWGGGGGGGASAARGAPVPRAGEVALGPSPPEGPVTGGTGRMGWGARSDRRNTNPGSAPLGGFLPLGEPKL